MSGKLVLAGTEPFLKEDSLQIVTCNNGKKSSISILAWNWQKIKITVFSLIIPIHYSKHSLLGSKDQKYFTGRKWEDQEYKIHCYDLLAALFKCLKKLFEEIILLFIFLISILQNMLSVSVPWSHLPSISRGVLMMDCQSLWRMLLIWHKNVRPMKMLLNAQSHW